MDPEKENNKIWKNISEPPRLFGKRWIDGRLPSISVTDKFWYMAKGHPKVGWAPMGFAAATPWTNLPQGIVSDIVLGWAPIGFAVMATSRASQYYFGHT